MVAAVDGFAEVARRMETLGWPVGLVPGWERRGAGTLTARGAVKHWTAGPTTGDCPSLPLVINGASRGLDNALANTYSSRTPKLYIVAAGVAWHAGLGSWRGILGNSGVAGHEAENSGQGEWSKAHLALDADLDAVQCDVFGYPPSMVCDHFEWAGPRKIDRRDVGGPPWRLRVSAAMNAPNGNRGDRLMYMCKQGDTDSDAVRLLQQTLQALGHDVSADGDYGPSTAAAVKAAGDWVDGGRVSPARCRKLENLLVRHVARQEIRQAVEELPKPVAPVDAGRVRKLVADALADEYAVTLTRRE